MEDPLTVLELMTPADADEKFYLEQNNLEHFGRYDMGSGSKTLEDTYEHLRNKYERVRQGLLAPYKIMHMGLYLGEVSLGSWPGPAAPSAWLGYHIDERWQGKSIVKQSAARLVRWGFEEQHLDEIFIGIRPSNLPSQRLAHRLGAEPLKGRHLKVVHKVISSAQGGDTPETWRIAA